VETAKAVQPKQWSRHPQDWADLQEWQLHCLYDAIIAGVVRPRMRLLDVGCGSGLFCRLALDAGATVSGIDSAIDVLAIARERVPEAEIVVGDIEELPWPDATFDVVTGIAAFSYTERPGRALREAARVLKPEGRVVIGTWGAAENCDAGVPLARLTQLLPWSAHDMPGPFRFSLPGALDAFVAEGGLLAERSEDVACAWSYPSLDIALRALCAGASAAAAIDHAGEDAVREALTRGLAPFADGGGGYRLENVFRYFVARPYVGS
jgi:SAM-dependent methyltransferase